MSDKFEAKFSDFLNSDACDTAEDALFSLLRTAFSAGWQAAGGYIESEDDKAPAEDF